MRGALPLDPTSVEQGDGLQLVLQVLHVAIRELLVHNGEVVGRHGVLEDEQAPKDNHSVNSVFQQATLKTATAKKEMYLWQSGSNQQSDLSTANDPVRRLPPDRVLPASAQA
jgi:hypothetical protein